MCSRHNYVCLHSTHMFGLKTVVGHNESGKYEINRHSVWKWVPVVALVKATPAALCGVIVPKVTPLLSTAVTRRQTQTCCGFKKKKKRQEKRKGLCLEQDVENELLLNPHKEILFFLSIQGYSHCIKHSKNRREKDTQNKYISLFFCSWQCFVREKNPNKAEQTARTCRYDIYWNSPHVSAWLSLHTQYLSKMDLDYNTLNYFTEWVFFSSQISHKSLWLQPCVNGTSHCVCFLWQQLWLDA